MLVVPIQVPYGWQAFFYLFGFLGVIWAIVWYAWFRDSPSTTAANAASAVSSIAFGYMVGYFGNYDAPFVPMVAILCVGTWLWLTVDPEHQLVGEEAPLSVAATDLTV